MSKRLTYCCPPSIVWARDADQTLVVDREAEQAWTLRGMEAALWDLLAVGHPYQRIVLMLSLILSLSAEEAEHTCTGILHQWQNVGIVRVRGEAAGDELDDQCGM